MPNISNRSPFDRVFHFPLIQVTLSLWITSPPVTLVRTVNSSPYHRSIKLYSGKCNERTRGEASKFFDPSNLTSMGMYTIGYRDSYLPAYSLLSGDFKLSNHKYRNIWRNITRNQGTTLKFALCVSVYFLYQLPPFDHSLVRGQQKVMKPGFISGYIVGH